MSTIVLRSVKGSPLTNTEVDNNFNNLNTDKYQAGGDLGTPSSGTVTNLTGTASININGTVGATTPASGSFTSLTDSGNLTFTGTGNRITGDFSNGTISNRVAFQSSTTNGSTAIIALPNGTSTDSSFQTFNGTDLVNGTRTTMSTSSTEGSFQVSRTGTGTYLPMTFYTGGGERLRIDTTGRIVVGYTSALSNYSAGGALRTPQIQVQGASLSFASQSITNWASGTTSTGASYLVLGKSQSNAVGTQGALTAADQYIGVLQFNGDDGTNFIPSAWIRSATDGVPGANDMPGRLEFGTTADGASAPTERMRINSSGNVGIGTTSPAVKLAISSTDAILLPKGTTAQQPTGVSGYLRFNTDTSQFEGYNGSAWASVGGAAISNDTTTATNLYPLFADATSGTALTVYTGNTKLLYKPSTGDLSSTAMVSSNGITINASSVSSNYTIATGTNGFSVGPLTINSGVTLTIASGQRHVII